MILIPRPRIAIEDEGVSPRRRAPDSRKHLEKVGVQFPKHLLGVVQSLHFFALILLIFTMGMFSGSYEEHIIKVENYQVSDLETGSENEASVILLAKSTMLKRGIILLYIMLVIRCIRHISHWVISAYKLQGADSRLPSEKQYIYNYMRSYLEFRKAEEDHIWLLRKILAGYPNKHLDEFARNILPKFFQSSRHRKIIHVVHELRSLAKSYNFDPSIVLPFDENDCSAKQLFDICVQLREGEEELSAEIKFRKKSVCSSWKKRYGRFSFWKIVFSNPMTTYLYFMVIVILKGIKQCSVYSLGTVADFILLAEVYRRF